MLNNFNIKNCFYTLILALSIIGCFIFGSMFIFNKNVYATEIIQPSYLSIYKSGKSYTYFDEETGTYKMHDTIFLDDQEELNITLGKPVNWEARDGNNIFVNGSDIGSYALQNLTSGSNTFSLQINGNNKIILSDYESYISFPTYTYQSEGFTYFDMKINLKSTLFEPGKYVFTFQNYKEHTVNNLKIFDDISFSFTLYILKSSDYFSENATKFDNVETTHPDTISYRNYYYYNYNNLNTNNTENKILPSLTFNASHFEITINKNVNGSKTSLKINKALFANNQVQYSGFVNAEYNSSTNVIKVVFNDIGEYVIQYTYIFEDTSLNKIINLDSEEIQNANTKNDVLYIFGYQMYYNGAINSNNEFKNAESNTVIDSADITYLITDENLIKSSQFETKFENKSDTTIKNLISSNGISPVSTNQPSVLTNTNAVIEKEYSYFYTLSNGVWSDAYDFENKLFTESQTYLLKLVYTYSSYYDSNTHEFNSPVRFAQYFFFTIDNSIPTITLSTTVDNITNILPSKSFTQHSVNVELTKNSPFDGQVVANIYQKDYTNGDGQFHLLTTLNSTTTSYLCESQCNYIVELKYGKNLSKTEKIYFTIDNSNFDESVNLIPVTLSTTGQDYLKDDKHIVDFFTNENIVAQWTEKLSGAKSWAEYKHIPFKKLGSVVFLSQGISTDYILNLDNSKEYPISTYSNSDLNIKKSNIFSEQGLYILHIWDEAGNSTYKYFCVDRTQIQAMQYDASSGSTNNGEILKNYTTISRNSTIIYWGKYKLISLNTTTDDLISDTWVSDAFNTILTNEQNNNIKIVNDKYYFAVEIQPTYLVQEGMATPSEKTDENGYTQIDLLKEFSNGETKANELTYVYYLIDESNKFFNEKISANEFIRNADRSLQITTTSDDSKANIVINESNDTNDFSLITPNNAFLTNAGFADSINSNNETLRTKYHFATGTTLDKQINILTYTIKLQPDNKNLNFKVSKITMYYYPFEIKNGYQTLSETATKTIILDEYTNILEDIPGMDGYSGFNIKFDSYNAETNTYQTRNGKYVIIREYNDLPQDSQDFLIRENVFIVDRDNIVTAPQKVNNKLVSSVGNDIFVNLLDGNEKAVQTSTVYTTNLNYIFQTNKLPVVVYVPIAKYGISEKKFNFIEDESLAYYLSLFYNDDQTTSNQLIRYKYLDNNKIAYEKSTLNLIYFGGEKELDASTKFDQNDAYKSNDYDLTVKITNLTTGEIILTDTNNSGYIMSAPIEKAGTYRVDIIQNELIGKIYPNVYNLYSFTFQIINLPPTFTYTSTSDNNTNSSSFNVDKNGVFYTNATDSVKVYWEDRRQPINVESYGIIDPTKISYDIYDSDGRIVPKNYISLSKVNTDQNNPYYHYFTITFTNNIKDNYRIAITMQYEGNVYPGLTQITKTLYIDRSAPMTVLENLIQKTNIGTTKFADMTRQYVNIEGTPTDLKSYNVSVTEGVLANYAFAVPSNALAPLKDMFSTQNSVNSYYINGYYYYFKAIDFNSSQTNISSALSSAGTEHTVAISNLQAGSYYEVIEMDLAKNISIYTIYIAGAHSDEVVIKFDREQTDNPTNNFFKFNELNTTQNIFAKTYFQATDLSLYNYPFIEFMVDGDLYFRNSLKSFSADGKEEQPAIYRFSDMRDKASTPERIELSNLLYFTAPDAHKLTILDPILNKQYAFNIYITNQPLKHHLLADNEGSDDEGIRITGSSNENIVIQNLSYIKISSYDVSSDSYIVIYEATNNFNSNKDVTVTYTPNLNTYIFKIVDKKEAYAYEFEDNYGIKYVNFHTVGTYVLDDDKENQKIKNFVEEVQITETINGVQKTNNWYVGTGNIIYNYSTSYRAHIKIYVLELSGNKLSWNAINSNISNPYGTAISTVSNTTIMQNGITYAYVTTSPIHQTIKQLTLYAPTYDTLLQFGFKGSAVRFEITLENTILPSEKNIITDRVLIFNLSPIVELKDKQNLTVSQNESLFAEQLKIISPELTYIANLASLKQNAQTEKYENFAFDKSTKTFYETDNQFLFEHFSTITYNNTTTELISGLIVSEPATYEIKNYILINGHNYLINSYVFVISESTTAYYTVLKQDENGQYIEVLPTGSTYTYISSDKKTTLTCYYHYIVKDDDVIRILPNKNQGIVIPEIPDISSTSTNCVTDIYTISNYEAAQTQNVSPYKTRIAISKIKESSSFTTYFRYAYNNEQSFTNLLSETQSSSESQDSNTVTKTSDTIVINENFKNVDFITIKFDAFYAIKENKITPIIYYGENNLEYIPDITYTSTYATFTLNTSGIYKIKFVDSANNTQIFTNSKTLEKTNYYTVKFIKGVPYLINNEQPIENAYYNNSVEISLLSSLTNEYSAGGSPQIVVLRNGNEYNDFVKSNGKYLINESGYYTVYFNAKVYDPISKSDVNLKREAYSFTIISSQDYHTTFDFSEYGNYRITSVLKNNVEQDYSNIFPYETMTDANNKTIKVLKNIALSLYDEKTGAGEYTLTIATNSTFNNSFTFSFIIKSIGVVPLSVSIGQGSSTTKTILIEFNALTFYQNIGESKIILSKQSDSETALTNTYSLNLNQEYVNSLTNSYQSISIDIKGTYFIQVYTSSGTLLYSYKVIKNDPLNTVSILVIIGSALAVAGLTVTIVLLRRKMKIK